MKVFGFDETDVLRGELRAAQVDARKMYFPDEVIGSMGWEYMSTRFSEARAELLSRMEEEGVDPEMIELVRKLKASYIPVEEEED